MRTWTLRRSWLRLLAAWLLATAVAAGAFRVWEVQQLGWHDADGSRRVRDRVTRAFAGHVGALDRAASTVESQAVRLARAVSEPRSARDAFRLLETVIPADGGMAASVYAPTGVPVAWAGRPTEIPRTRLGVTPVVFVAPGPQGPRLFSVRPVFGGGGVRTPPSGPRLATVAIEIPLPTNHAASPHPPESVVWPAGLVHVQMRARYQGAGGLAGPGAFTLAAPDGTVLLEGSVVESDVANARRRARRHLMGGLGLLTAAFAALALFPLSGWRNRQRSAWPYAAGTAGMVVLLAGARLASWWALPAAAGTPVGHRPGLLASPVDFLLTAGTLLALVAVLGATASRLRVGVRRRRVAVGPGRGAMLAFVAICVAASGLAVAVLAAMLRLIQQLATKAPNELLAFSVHHGAPAQLPLEVGLVLASAASVWLAVLTLRAALPWFRLERPRHLKPLAWVAWATVPAVLIVLPANVAAAASPGAALAGPAALAVAAAAGWRALLRRYRHGSQASRLFLLCAALVLPALSWYPSLYSSSDAARQGLIAGRLAAQALSQRDDLQARVRQALVEIDRLPGLEQLVQPLRERGAVTVTSEAAFHVWSRTGLSRARLTSAIELYGSDRLLASRFALKLPDYASAQQVWEGSGCDWELFEEVSPFFSEERRLLYAGRGICAPGPGGLQVVGAIAIYAMLDYADLPFIAAQIPYAALVRGEPAHNPESVQSRGLDFVVYGWSRTPLYASGSTWTLDDDTFRRVYASRSPFWTELSSGGRHFAVHITNDQGGIYALGYPRLSAIEHLVNLAELTVLGGLTFVALTLLSWLAVLLGGRPGMDGRDLLREVRASFYRKLFLAFVAAAAVPIITLAFVAQAYLAARLLAGVEEAAARTASVAQRVVEDYAQLQEGGERRADTVDDDILAWIARVIDQDVDVFDGTALMATSERSLYASGVLPVRTSADIYRAIVLDRRAAYVARDRVGWFDYLSAAAPVRLGGREAILTVPLTLRQQAIEREIDDLTRRIVLAVLVFILAGSMLGYWMAERIADPVNRLQRATTRIARGDLTVRVALTASDELRRLVEAFNQMAAELQRQQSELARVFKLEAWADMARQVAHDIKNPLTPIQLSAEHLRRVHTDRGSPLSPVLDSCVESILTQVRLLRQIAGEFSSFASSPTARPVRMAVDELLAEVVDPYRPGLAGRVEIRVTLAPALPPVLADRTLLGRALTNVIDNALHAMPNGGTLDVSALAGPGTVMFGIADTGVGMDEAAIAHIFEPYFSTKATGTGLGLTIAKRNVELNGGAIAIRSEPGAGTVVTMTVPQAPA